MLPETARPVRLKEEPPDGIDMRSKKPWYRPRNIVLLALLGLVLLLGFKAVGLVMARPVISVNYSKKVAEMVAANQPADAPDAWPTYLHAVETAQEIGDEVRTKAPAIEGFRLPDFPLIYTPDVPYKPEPGTDPGLAASEAQEAADKAAHAATAREWTLKCLPLLKDRGVYDDLARLKTATRFVRPPTDGALLAILLPDLGESRALARALVARMYLAGRAGDDADLVEAFEESLALARVVGHQATLIERLVGMATSSLAMSRVRDEAMRRRLDGPTCRALLAAMDRQAGLPPMSLPMRTERCFFLDVVQRTYSDDGHGNGYRLQREVSALGLEGGGANASAVPGSALLNMTGVLYPSRAALVAEGEKIYGRMAEAADTARGQRKWSSVDVDVESLPRGYDVLRLLVPAVGKALQSHDQHTLEVAGTRVMLAIEAFRAEQGRLPATLDALVPGVLPTLPSDPFAPDGRLRYRVLAQPDELGRVYLLYSIGADRVDNQGFTKPKVSATSSHADGTDFVINAPPEAGTR